MLVWGSVGFRGLGASLILPTRPLLDSYTVPSPTPCRRSLCMFLPKISEIAYTLNPIPWMESSPSNSDCKGEWRYLFPTIPILQGGGGPPNIYPIPYTLYLIYTLDPIPYTLYLGPYTLNPKPFSLNPIP